MLRGPQPLGPRAASVVAARRLRRPSARRAEGRFLAEGFQAVEAALATGRLTDLFVGESAAARFGELVAKVAGTGVPVRPVTDPAAAALSETVTPQGLVGVATLPATRLADLTGLRGRPAGEATRPAGGTGQLGQAGMVRPSLVAVCVAANDPGNAGTVIRTADAAGADAVVFAGDGVDPFGGKCVRSSAGSLFHLPVVMEPDLGVAVDWLRANGCRVVATSGHGARDLYEAADAGELDGPTGWLFGNEAHGLSPDALAAADAVLRVPVYGQAESLNLAVATALCLYASARARRMARSGTHGTGGGERR
ncbi:TrmH family RNA methyltransferase [Pseudofrankia inefficax]|uniref:tRNA/rRNA methyltransferase (SpoU) n=1 Tax=Pseudofrankia inefficax (strain DSM 45817 / CECT 9037 / DDB 130130 / EuI1c) TaxID=298654 RepID=E3JA59_PSEI1|nr:RNA methyltransferase [Pseudofrankia inefficax]ADP79761.1 tRNA/rRNA methyltransferase (SpoU) [Pseudofrankia inefficax]